MSYSFSVKASTKAELPALVKAEFDKVVLAQPSHAADKKAAEDAVAAFVGIVREPAANEHIAVSVSGSLSWQTTNAEAFYGSGISVNVFVSAAA
jgi:hypothetical protein